MKKYFYKLLSKYLKVFIREENSVAEINPRSDQLSLLMNSAHYKSMDLKDSSDWEVLKSGNYDYYILNGTLHFERDIQDFLTKLHVAASSHTRVLICYYSALWGPFMRLASRLGLRKNLPEQNWISPTDLANFCELSGFELINRHQRVLIPFFFPVLSYLFNRWLAPLPVFRFFTLMNIAIVRPKGKPAWKHEPSVSVLVPARNEAGNIENIVNRLPKMGPDDELIFIEGNSTDNTWEVIQQVAAKYSGQMNIVIGQQDGKGKGDAVRKGFGMATKDILMILDADITVPPEDLPKFYNAMKNGTGEFINGSRLVYPMEKEAMRFFNILGNKFFAMAFTFVLNQPLKDTLCGTKVLSAANYRRVAANRSYFGNFDPFGDFDLLFGASRLGLKIIEVPITYRARTYGDTNIQRWKHGAILLRMLLFASRKLKFI